MRFRIFLALLPLTMLASCSGSGSKMPTKTDIEGSWYRTIEYVGGTQRMSYTFNQDMTGIWSSEGRSTQFAYFTYSIRGNEIHCTGAYGNNYGSVSEWSSIMIYNGNFIYSKKDANDIYGREVVIDDRTKEFKPTGDKLVDMGLSVKWAGWNVGASSPEESGGYYSWGEVTEKYEYNLGSYLYYKKFIGNDISSTQYDVASKLWGDGWRMPTLNEIEELVKQCRWVEYTHNGVRGNTVIGPNGNKIFIPLAGYKQDNRCYAKAEKAYIWSSRYYPNESNRAYCIYTDPSDAYRETHALSKGFSVRAVKD